jgi:cation diffusion facilitator CzcD-associated flavoprotein CzcO
MATADRETGDRQHDVAGSGVGMTQFCDMGAAVVGSGFIGTVHIEALRRIGVRVVGLLEATPESGGDPRGRRRPGRARHVAE